MKFILLDKITELEKGKRIKGIKNLSLAEDYLADHFPNFPVMPGVLMLESMVQISAWLIRATDDFSQSVVYLQEARNVKYAKFVKPGQYLELEAQINNHDEHETRLTVSGRLDGEVAVSAKLVLAHRSLRDGTPAMDFKEKQVINKIHNTFELLCTPELLNRQ